MIATMKRHCLSGASAAAIAAALMLVPDRADAACYASVPLVGGVPQSVVVDCTEVNESERRSEAFATSFEDVDIEGMSQDFYQGNGNDRITFRSGEIVQGNGIEDPDVQPNPPFITGADSESPNVYLDERIDRIETLDGNDQVIVTSETDLLGETVAGTIGSNIANVSIYLGDGADTFTIEAGNVYGAVLGQDGNDIFQVYGGILHGSFDEDAEALGIEGVAIDSGDGNDTLIVGRAGSDDDGQIGQESAPITVLLGAGVDTFTLNSGTIYGTVDTGAGDDILDVTGGQIGTSVVPGAVFMGSGADRFTMSGGTIYGNIFGQGGSEASGSVLGNAFAISGGTIDGMIFTGSQNDTVTISGTANVVGRNAAPDAIGLEDGDDVFLMTGGAVGAAVSGGNGVDRLTVEGGTINDFLAGNQDDDIITIVGGVIIGGVQGNEGADRISMSGGSTGVLTGDEGNDAITISGTAQLQTVLGAAGGDTIGVQGGTVAGGVSGGEGDDSISMAGGTVSGGVNGDAGDDVLSVSGGTVNGGVNGNLGGDTINISGTAVVNGGANGGDGNDSVRLSGGTVNDFIAGGAGNDNLTVSGGFVNGAVSGEDGDDTLVMSAGRATSLKGGAGTDNITISETAQIGEAAATTIFAQGVDGDDGDDVIRVTGGQIYGDVWGGGGNDTLDISGGSMRLVNGADGDDMILIGGSAAVASEVALTDATPGVYGEAGNDTIVVAGGAVSGSVQGDGGADALSISAGTIGGGADSTTGLGMLGGAGADTIALTGGSVAATSGGDGDDVLELGGTGRVRSLSGDGGADTIRILGGVVVAQVDGDTNDSDETNDGADTIVMTGGSIGGALASYGGNDRVELRGGTIAGGADAGSGDDTVIIAGTGIDAAMGLGAGNDALTMTGGSVAAAISGAAGNDTISVSGGQVSGSVDGGEGGDAISVVGGAANGGVRGGGGNDVLSASGGIVAGGLNGDDGDDSINLSGTATVNGGVAGGGGSDTVLVRGGQVDGGVGGDAGDDTLSVSGGVINGGLNGAAGNDSISVSGTATVNGGANGGDGNDSVTISGGTVNNGANGGAGADSLILSGGTVNDGVNGGADGDTITVSGGTANGGIDGGAGADVVNVSGGAVNQNVAGGNGADTVELRGGTVGGGINAETVRLFGGTVGGDITGLSGNTLVINDAAAPAALILRDGVLFSGTDAVGTIIDTDLAAAGRSQNFSGFSSLSLTNSTLRFEGGTQTIDDLSLAGGSTLFMDGVTVLGAQNGGFGNLSVASSILDMRDGGATDRLTLGGIALNGATIGIDVNQSEGLADLIAANGTASATGDNVLLVNLVGGVELSGSTEVAFLTADGAPLGGAFGVEVTPGTAASLFDYEVVAGPGGGLVLRATPVAGLVGLVSSVDAAAAVAALETSVQALEGVNDDAIEYVLGLAGGGGLPNDALFGVFASGQFARVEHDGFRVSDGLVSFNGPSFDSEDFSAAISVDFNAAKYWGFDAEYGLNLGVFTGYTSTDLTTDGLNGFASIGSADNESGMAGVYALMRREQNYLLLSATGFWGETTTVNGVLDGAEGEYATDGYAVTASAGHIFALGERARFDLRGGLLGASFTGDAYTDTRGVRHGETEISFGAVKFEPGVYADYKLENGMVFSPYARADVQLRFGYENTASADVRTFEFDDDDFSAALSSGFNLRMNESTTLSGEVRGKASSDSTTLAAKLGLKVAF